MTIPSHPTFKMLWESILHQNMPTNYLQQTFFFISFLGSVFTAGFFTQILNSLTDLKEPNNYQLISSLLLDNVYVVEGWAETFLHANFPDLRKTLTKSIYRTLKPCQFLTYQINEEISLRDMWTIIYTVFLLGFCAGDRNDQNCQKCYSM